MAGDDLIGPWAMRSLWRHAERHFRDGSAALYYVSVEVHILARVDDADPAGEDGHSAKGERVDMGGCIDAARHLRDENMSRSSELCSQCTGEVALGIRCVSLVDNSNVGLTEMDRVTERMRTGGASTAISRSAGKSSSPAQRACPPIRSIASSSSIARASR